MLPYLGKRKVFEDVIKHLTMRSSWMIQWARYPMTCVLSIDIQRRRCNSGGRDWSGVIQTAIKDASNPQKLKVLRNRSSLRVFGGSYDT